MDEGTGIHTWPFDTTLKSPILLVAVKTQNSDIGLPILFFCTSLEETCSDKVTLSARATKKYEKGILNWEGYRDFQINESVAPKSHSNGPYFSFQCAEEFMMRTCGVV